MSTGAPEDPLASLRKLKGRARARARAGLLREAMETMTGLGFTVAHLAEREEVLAKVAEIIPPGARAVYQPCVVGRALGLDAALRDLGRDIVVLPTDGDLPITPHSPRGGQAGERPRRPDDPNGEWREHLLAAQFGITGATALIADTGSLVLAEDSGFGRAASNVPPVHVALLTADCVVENLLDAATVARGYAALHLGRAAPRYLSLISGPSRTADIAITLVRGMHGPRTVHVVIWNRPKAEGTGDDALRTWVLA